MAGRSQAARTSERASSARMRARTFTQKMRSHARTQSSFLSVSRNYRVIISEHASHVDNTVHTRVVFVAVRTKRWLTEKRRAISARHTEGLCAASQCHSQSCRSSCALIRCSRRDHDHFVWVVGLRVGVRSRLTSCMVGSHSASPLSAKVRDCERKEGFDHGCGHSSQREKYEHHESPRVGEDLYKVCKSGGARAQNGFEQDGRRSFRTFLHAERAKVGAHGRFSIVTEFHEIVIRCALAVDGTVGLKHKDEDTREGQQSHACSYK